MIFCYVPAPRGARREKVKELTGEFGRRGNDTSGLGAKAAKSKVGTNPAMSARCHNPFLPSQWKAKCQPPAHHEVD